MTTNPITDAVTDPILTSYGDFQFEIYGGGTRGVLPKYPVDFAGLERKAAEAMPPWVYSYVGGGCGDENTQRANVSAFTKWGLVPRMGRPSTGRDMSIELFGRRLPSPLLMAPVGVAGICSQDFHGDLAAARASARTGVPLVQSTLSQDPLEDIAAASGDTPIYFSLYMPRSRDLALSFIHRAEAAGYEAIIVTLDTWTIGWRPRDLNLASFPQMRGLCVSNFYTDKHFLAQLDRTPEEDPQAATALFAEQFAGPVTWDDIAWMRTETTLPLLVKGVSHPDDVKRAADLGVDGVYCSNHGGRQANGGVPNLDLLPGVVEAAGGLPVIFDSGVRSGTDVVKALALGATAVGIGRPYAYALAVGGEDCVVHLLRSTLAEADLLMGLDGYPTLAELRSAGLRPVR